MTWRKARDGILVLTLFGAIGLLPPILPFFDRPVTVLGMPLIVVYVFGAWLALIAGARWLSYRLPRHGGRGGLHDGGEPVEDRPD